MVKNYFLLTWIGGRFDEKSYA